jgi:hypothetical protein
MPVDVDNAPAPDAHRFEHGIAQRETPIRQLDMRGRP